MEIHTHAELMDRLTREWTNKPLNVIYTHWEGDGEDEEEIRFPAVLSRVLLSDNEFGEKDLLLEFEAGDETWEILMEIPGEESDLAHGSDDQLRIFGMEAEVILQPQT